MRKVSIALLAPVVGLAVVGCATKKYVQETVGTAESKLDVKIGTQGKRIDEQSGKVAAQAKQISDMGPRFTKIETSIDEFGNVARSAASRADEAYMKAENVDSRVTKLLASRNERKLVETIEVQFGYNRADLSDGAQTALAELIKELADNPTLQVDLEGYTDWRGSAQYNLDLSERRVTTVRRFLVQHGIDMSRINWIGMGAIPERGSRADLAKNRRVTVRLILPGEEMTAGAMPAPDAPEAREESPGESTPESAPETSETSQTSETSETLEGASSSQ
jgi:outer membrane protein OmpA-like peptidoglycan-associated protein